MSVCITLILVSSALLFSPPAFAFDYTCTVECEFGPDKTCTGTVSCTAEDDYCTYNNGSTGGGKHCNIPV